MNRIAALLPLLCLWVLPLSALAAKQAEQPQRQPAWMDALSQAGDAGKQVQSIVESEISAAAAARKARPSEISKTFGTNAVRNAMANKYNQMVSQAVAVGERYKVKQVGLAFATVDGLSKTLGRLYEGDVSGAAGVAAEETGGFFASSAGTAAGAWLGAKTFAAAGAALGSVVPVAGTTAGAVVGGAIGGVAGGFVASGAYSFFVDNVIKPYASWAAEPDYLEQARQARAAFLASQAMAAEGARISPIFARNMEQYGYGVGATPAPDAETLLPSTPPALALPQVPTTQPPATTQGPGASIPVIPVDCTIHTVAMDPQNPIYQWKNTFHLLDGKVTGESNNTFAVGPCTYTYRGTFTGTVTDNVISGTWSGRNHTTCPGNCPSSSDSTMVSRTTLTLHQGGRLTEDIGGGTDSGTYTSKCATSASHSFTNAIESFQFIGTWSFGSRGGKP